MIPSLESIHTLAVAAGMDPNYTDFGLTKAQEAVEHQRRNQELLAELASRPKIEVLRVAVLNNRYGGVDFTVTIRNNSTTRLDSLETALYAL